MDVQPGDPGEPGGPAEDCGQDEVTPGPGDGPYFCNGGIPCAYTTNVVPLALPTTEPPPGQEWQVMICHHGGYFTKDWVLTNGTQPRPLIVQAQEAYGNLAPPAAAVRHSPDTRGIVGLATWLWLAPGSFGELRGSSAEGLVAVAGRTAPTGPPVTAGRSAAPAPARRTGPPAARLHAHLPPASARYDGHGHPDLGRCTTSRAATRSTSRAPRTTLTANTPLGADGGRGAGAHRVDRRARAADRATRPGL